MSELENRLREALRREEPPEGFADRVLAAVAGRDVPLDRKRAAPFRAWFGAPRLRWAAAFAGVVLVIAGGAEYRKQRLERLEGERAKEQVMLALRITGSKLRMIQAKVQELNR